ncbi:MAG: glutaredoxin family protein [Actinobacteria bacterium]|nr:glutaredoxin family protein [Actinomycetota bacterium]
MSRFITIYSRRGCHLCEVAVEKVRDLQPEYGYQVQEIFIDGDSELSSEYGEQVPVIHIDGKPHDFFRVNEERFRAALS